MRVHHRLPQDARAVLEEGGHAAGARWVEARASDDEAAARWESAGSPRADRPCAARTPRVPLARGTRRNDRLTAPGPSATVGAVTDARRTALIAIDWGTTSARAYRLDAPGDVLADAECAARHPEHSRRRFAAALDTLLGDWRDEPAPRIACGMIGSRQGWIEAPYVDCPADLARLGGALTRTPAASSPSCPARAASTRRVCPTCMRGEETQTRRCALPRRRAACSRCCRGRTANGRWSSAGGCSSSRRS